MKKNVLIYLILFAFISCNDRENYDLIEIAGSTMGTTYSVKYLGNSSKSVEEVKSKISLILENGHLLLLPMFPQA